VTIDNDTDTLANGSKPNIKLVKEKNLFELSGIAIMSGLYGFFAGAFLMLFLIAMYPTIFGNQLLNYVIWASVPITIVIFAFLRNILLRRLLRLSGHRHYLDFSYNFRKLVYACVFTIVIVYTILGYSDSRYYLLATTVFFGLMPFHTIFQDSLTEKGEIVLLFEMLSPPIKDFSETRKYWSKIAIKVEDKLSDSHITVSRKQLVYQFSKKLLICEDDKEITDNIGCIKEWLLGNQKSCYNGLWWLDKNLVLSQKKDNFMLKWFFEHPDQLIKYGFALIILAVVLVTNQQSILTILQYLGL
jgi:hypothetical protein